MPILIKKFWVKLRPHASVTAPVTDSTTSASCLK